MSDPAFRQDLVLFEVTPRCNQRCAHCYNVWTHPRAAGARPGELPPDRLRALIDRVLDQTRCRQVTLTGGEPLLRADLADRIAQVAVRGVHVNLITNGSLLDEPRTRELVSAGAALFELPLHSHRREENDAIAGFRGAFDRVTEAIARLRLLGAQVVVVFVLTRRNAGDFAETVRLARLLGAQGIMLNRVNPGGRGVVGWRERLPTLEQVRSTLEEANRLAAAGRIAVSCSIPLPPCLIDRAALPRLGFGFCAAGTARRYLTVDPLGNLRPCNHTSRVLGNLFEHTFEELAQGDLLREFCGGRASACAGCALEADCLGGCKAAAEECFGSLQADDPFVSANREAVRPLVSAAPAMEATPGR